jgi:hypothetical protein
MDSVSMCHSEVLCYTFNTFGNDVFIKPEDALMNMAAHARRFGLDFKMSTDR